MMRVSAFPAAASSSHHHITPNLLHPLFTTKISSTRVVYAITKSKPCTSTITTPINASDFLAIPNINLANIFNKLDDLICTFLDRPLRPGIDPAHVLSGNFAPVDELPPTPCTVVEGSLPACLDGGAYIRNGPNPHLIFKGRPYHYLDGDGMLHMITISKGGHPIFCSRYVKTHKYLAELAVGYPFVPSVFASFNGLPATLARFMLIVARVITGQFDPMTRGLGVANTSLAMLGHRLFALCESDLPYAVRPTKEGDMVTLGRCNFDSEEPFSGMTAHPKIDRDTGEVFAFAKSVARPFLTFFRITQDGRKSKELPIRCMQEISGMHDFAMTKNYIVFPDIQIVVDPAWILRGKSPVGIDPAKVPRLGVLPKHTEDDSELCWIDAPGLNMLHCFNSWEENEDTIVIIASNSTSVERIFEDIKSTPLTMEKMTINLKTKVVQRQLLSEKSLDFAVINPSYAGKKNRYIYAGVLGRTSLEGVVKLDMSLDCTVGCRIFGPGCSGGEPFFVAREPENPTADEDDGYLVTYVHDEGADESKFLVMDAKSPTLEIVAAVKLPRRVPNGIHGLFLSRPDVGMLQ